MERKIEELIIDQVKLLNRPDLFRKPIIAFSSAKDERFKELKNIIGEWHESPNQILADAQSVISYFVPFTKDVVDGPNSVEGVSEIWSESYVVINKYFNHINDEISKYLVREGYSTKLIAPTHTYDPEDLKSTWSHRSAAAIAGLGRFGLNRMLISDKGCGGRYGTVITSAILLPNEKTIENKCLYMHDGSCSLCVEVCPVDALHMDGDFEKFTCHNHLLKNQETMKEKSLIASDSCGKCISVCPVAYME